MTVMKRNSNTNLIHESAKINLQQEIDQEQQQQQQQQQQLQQIVNAMDLVEHNHHHNQTVDINGSRKNSASGMVLVGVVVAMPASNLSISSASSSTSSSVVNSKQDVQSLTSNSQNQKYNVHHFSSSNHTSKHNSTSTPQTSRRPSGNSITIRITSENNVNIEDEELNSVLNGEDNRNYEYDENDPAYDRDKDRDDGEDTTSNSTSNEYSPTNSKHQPRKKLKERKKLVRSAAQQQHHLIYQESEDQPEEQLQRSQDEEPQIDYSSQNMNSAFDELFAAAETGNNSISAAIEAKMAAAAAEASAASNLNDLEENDGLLTKKNSIVRSRNGSFRSSKNGSVKRIFPFSSSNTPTPPSLNVDSRTTLNDTNLATTPTSQSSKKLFINNNLKTDSYLGSPQQLTRSCSCKRPGSFKKMRSKNSSPNRAANNASSPVAANGSNNCTNIATTPSNVSGRRGTQCSISIMNDIDLNKNRAGSLPFENFIEQHKLQTPTFIMTPNDEDNCADVYRVRQFNITNKGSVINRGDSFKRSFKRSNQSISSNNHNKKDNSSGVNVDTNTLALPDQDAFLNRSSNSSNLGINETSFNGGDSQSSNGAGNGVVESKETQNIDPTAAAAAGEQLQSDDSVETFIVYILGASTVGKNALIKQFKTSEYRGTYEITPNQSNADEEQDEGVSVMLDGVESRLQFISIDVDSIKQGFNSIFEITKDNNAFVIVYSISDKSSFHVSVDLLKCIRNSENKNQPVILVGNKSDLVRKRSISREEGRNTALKYGCKFVETSVAINDKVDDLLAGVLKQIRLSEGKYINGDSSNKKHSRNYSDAHLHELIKKSTNNNTNINNTISFKSNTLTRRLFKPKSKDKEASTNSDNSKSNMSSINTSANNANNNSFFHKLFNTIFKKKSTQSQLQSVENLFTSPVSMSKLKKVEK